MTAALVPVFMRDLAELVTGVKGALTGTVKEGTRVGSLELLHVEKQTRRSFNGSSN